MAAGQPKPAFYVVVGLVVVALVGFAVYRMSGSGGNGSATTPDIQPIQNVGGRTPEDASKLDPGALTEKEYEIIPAQRLIPVKGRSGYTPLAETNGTVRFAINVWAGWGPIVLANNGFKPEKTWKTPTGEEFKVELVLIDDVQAMREAYAAGKVHIGWGTLDMVPLFLQTLVNKEGQPEDTRLMPRVYQQIDWSNGGDGIVVRKNVNNVAELRGKKVAYTEFSPSHYFLLNMLVNGGVQPREIQPVRTRTAFQAASAFNDQPDIAGCVSWAPDIYKLEEGGNKILVSTAQANKLIADVWFARADFARDYPGIIEALVRGIFDAMAEMQTEDEAKAKAVKEKVAELMAAGYNLPKEATFDMQADAHITNWAENYQFFVNQNNPTNFERVWNNAYFLYSHPQVGAITHKPVPFDQVMDFTYIKKLAEEPKYQKQRDLSKRNYVPAPIPMAEENFLGSRFYIHFYPNSSELFRKVTRQQDGKDVEQLYDPDVDKTIDRIAQLVGQFGAARIVIEGHSDSSMKGQVPPEDLSALEQEVRKLSENRAKAVKEALVEKYKLDPNQLTVRGMGWDRPADPNAPNDHTKNRRVEVKVYAAEAK